MPYDFKSPLPYAKKICFDYLRIHWVVLNLKISIHFYSDCIYFLKMNSLGTNYVFVTPTNRNHESTNPVFTNLKCCILSFLVKIKYYCNSVFCIFWLKSKALTLATLPKKNNITKTCKNRIRRHLFHFFLMSRTGYLFFEWRNSSL